MFRRWPGTVSGAPSAVTPVPQPVIEGGILGTAPMPETDASPLMVPHEAVANADTGEPERGPHGYPVLGTPLGGRSGGGSLESTARMGLAFRAEQAYEGSDEFDVVPLSIVDVE